jgi:hypothetical protein
LSNHAVVLAKQQQTALARDLRSMPTATWLVEASADHRTATQGRLSRGAAE